MLLACTIMDTSSGAQFSVRFELRTLRKAIHVSSNCWRLVHPRSVTLQYNAYYLFGAYWQI
jgi:hypothetical protein